MEILPFLKNATAGCVGYALAHGSLKLGAAAFNFPYPISFPVAVIIGTIAFSSLSPAILMGPVKLRDFLKQSDVIPFFSVVTGLAVASTTLLFKVASSCGWIGSVSTPHIVGLAVLGTGASYFIRAYRGGPVDSMSYLLERFKKNAASA